jgi:Phage integrase, N-terminal SAM-like domain
MDGGYYGNLRGSGGAARDRRPTDREARHTHLSYSGQEPQMAAITLLRQRVIEDKTVRNLSPATRQSYIYAVAKFSRQFNRSPDQLSSLPPGKAPDNGAQVPTAQAVLCQSENDLLITTSRPRVLVRTPRMKNDRAGWPGLTSIAAEILQRLRSSGTSRGESFADALLWSDTLRCGSESPVRF